METKEKRAAADPLEEAMNAHRELRIKARGALMDVAFDDDLPLSVRLTSLDQIGSYMDDLRTKIIHDFEEGRPRLAAEQALPDAQFRIRTADGEISVQGSNDIVSRVLKDILRPEGYAAENILQSLEGAEPGQIKEMLDQLQALTPGRHLQVEIQKEEAEEGAKLSMHVETGPGVAGAGRMALDPDLQPQPCPKCGRSTLRALCLICSGQVQIQKHPAEEAGYPCKICGRPIDTAELCEACAKGNDPFFTSKYSEGSRG